MLEDLAIQFVNQSEDTLTGIDVGLTIVGAVIAAIVTRSEVEIARAPYFAYTALIIFAVSAVQIVWLLVIPAVTGGYLWVLVAITLTAQIAAGYFYYRTAMGRSRDAYGHGSMAVIAFIPIANFWLFLIRSKNAKSAERLPTGPLLSGGLGVGTGFVVLAATIAMNIYIERRILAIEQQAQIEPVSEPAQIEPVSEQEFVDSLIRSEGLEEALRMLAAEAQTPITVDEVTTLARIEAAWTQLRRTYIVDLEGVTLTEEFSAGSRDGICAWSPFRPILQAGGSIRELYVERSGREIGAVMVTRTDCGF